jgi:hypothetical protein
MSRKLKVLACLSGVVVPWLFAVLGPASAADETFVQTATVVLPPTPVINPKGGTNSFDIGFDDADIHAYALADRTNKAIDIVDTRTNSVTRELTGCGGNVQFPSCSVFAGGSGATGGPNGVIIVDHKEVWAGDGNSNIVAINIADNSVLLNTTTGGLQRADELCEDVGHEVVLIANDEAVDSFVTFWSTETHAMVGKIVFKAGGLNNTKNIIANGIEQCKHDPRTDKFYLNIPATLDSNGKAAPGVVVRISTHAPFKVEDVIPVDPSCVSNAGMALGPKHQILLGCSASGTGSVIIDDRTGANLKKLPGQYSDESWYNPGDNQYFLAVSTPGTLSISDPDGAEDSTVTTHSGSHSVAADMLKNQVYIPVNGPDPKLCGNDSHGTPLNGCIAVFTAKHDDKCLAEGMPVLDHDDGDDPVFMRVRCDDDRDDHDRDR